jgi:hypothetical protein
MMAWRILAETHSLTTTVAMMISRMSDTCVQASVVIAALSGRPMPPAPTRPSTLDSRMLTSAGLFALLQALPLWPVRAKDATASRLALGFADPPPEHVGARSAANEVLLSWRRPRRSSSAYDIVLRSLKRVIGRLTENFRQPTLRRLAKFYPERPAQLKLSVAPIRPA